MLLPVYVCRVCVEKRSNKTSFCDEQIEKISINTSQNNSKGRYGFFESATIDGKN